MLKKEEIRQNIKKIFSKISENILQEKNIEIKNKILQNHMVKKSKTIGFFIGGNFEPETKVIIQELLKKGKEIFLPKILDNNEMIFCKINSIEDLEVGKFNILEPKSDIIYENIEVFLVPGIAFSRDGKRIGKGKGYYDKYFSKFKNNYKIGVCFDFQVLDDFEVESWDVLMDEIIF